MFGYKFRGFRREHTNQFIPAFALALTAAVRVLAAGCHEPFTVIIVVPCSHTFDFLHYFQEECRVYCRSCRHFRFHVHQFGAIEIQKICAASGLLAFLTYPFVQSLLNLLGSLNACTSVVVLKFHPSLMNFFLHSKILLSSCFFPHFLPNALTPSFTDCE